MNLGIKNGFWDQSRMDLGIKNGFGDQEWIWGSRMDLGIKNEDRKVWNVRMI